MPISRRLVGYVGVFAILMIACTLLLGAVWRPLDYVVFSALSKARPFGLNDDMLIVDLPYRDSAGRFDLPDFRRRTTGLLQLIAALGDRERPRAIVLDLFFNSDDRELEALQAAIRQLQDNRTRVYAVFNTLDLTGKSFEQRMAKQAAAIYAQVDGGLLHTRFDLYNGVVTYPSEIMIPYESGMASARVLALPIKVAADLNGIDEPAEPRSYVLPAGDQADIESRTYRFVHGQQDAGGRFTQAEVPVPRLPDLHEKIIIVSSFEGDVEVLGRAGPEYVAWAIDDQRNGNRNARIPLDSAAAILALVLFCAVWACLVYALLFKYVRSLQTRPAVIALLAMSAGALLLVCLTAVFLTTGFVIPVGLAVFAIVIASALAWHFANRFLVTGVAEGAGKYDVFISYSRKDGDWVYNHLYQPLSQVRKPDGSELAIFFDRNEISLGEAFTSKYMWAIVDSQFFIPVFSENYYGSRSHGRNEMDLAYKRQVEKLITILPLAFADDAVPEIYNGLNYLNVSLERDFLESLASALGVDGSPGRNSGPDNPPSQ